MSDTLDQMNATEALGPFDGLDSSIDPVSVYLKLTRTVLPQLAHQEARNWPVKRDHCFQRIVLDTLCGGVWYDHISRPAYKHLSNSQACRAVQLCEAIIAGRVDIWKLNRQSLIWRGKLPTQTKLD